MTRIATAASLLLRVLKSLAAVTHTCVACPWINLKGLSLLFASVKVSRGHDTHLRRMPLDKPQRTVIAFCEC